ncbi:MAG: YigZ family protein [Bacteroidetes bacterium GWC2_33_15]|nr:MAG: YigZ family protein [Bacteroidetes bacterium GWA2_33_15]OFX48610.1 MAG: YigZ family protein [Bacteroidetes bacterium GWC2_33_15]OFX64584.1 MAG: YigZ family protein [Bacteroidetes bacterium GWB2_32_14]OFX67998.1 MAG: YigZ family protein [Bacteroidetes bacterium GWD2_33_33]
MAVYIDEYLTISKPSEGLFKDRGSKFIALAFPVTSENEVKEILEKLRNDYHDARHHCYAYMLGPEKNMYRANDDGEPSGTAGKPVLGQIKSFDLTNVLIVVIRYFGGTKLGVSGLIHAYKTAAEEALKSAEIIKKILLDYYQLKFEYPAMNEIMRILKEENIEQIDQKFDLSCSITIRFRKADTEKVLSKFDRVEKLKIEFVETK